MLLVLLALTATGTGTHTAGPHARTAATSSPGRTRTGRPEATGTATPFTKHLPVSSASGGTGLNNL